MKKWKVKRTCSDGSLQSKHKIYAEDIQGAISLEGYDLTENDRSAIRSLEFSQNKPLEEYSFLQTFENALPENRIQKVEIKLEGETC